MPTATDNAMSPKRPPPCRGPDGAAPPGWRWQVWYRRRRSDAWQVLVEVATAELAWSAMCESRMNGRYWPRLMKVRTAPRGHGGR